MKIGNDVRFNVNKKTSRDIARGRAVDAEPVRVLDFYMYTKEEIKNLPKSHVCEKHGEFQFKYIESFGGKIMVSSICNSCIEEYDAKIDSLEDVVKREQQELAKENKHGKREDYLLRNGFSKRYIDKSFDNYDADTPEKKSALSKCKRLCDAIITEESSDNLILVGGVGTGKTHLANAMVKFLYDNDKYARRVNLIDMVRSLKATWNKDNEMTEEELIDIFTTLDLLIIDEVGIQFNSDTEKLFIFDVINGRYENCLPTVIASNEDIEDVKKIIGDRCVDRLKEGGGKVVAFKWRSYRTR